jgi:hypothetical protein
MALFKIYIKTEECVGVGKFYPCLYLSIVIAQKSVIGLLFGSIVKYLTKILLIFLNASHQRDTNPGQF